MTVCCLAANTCCSQCFFWCEQCEYHVRHKPVLIPSTNIVHVFFFSPVNVVYMSVDWMCFMLMHEHKLESSRNVIRFMCSYSLSCTHQTSHFIHRFIYIVLKSWHSPRSEYHPVKNSKPKHFFGKFPLLFDRISLIL